MATTTMTLDITEIDQLNTLRVELKQWEKAFADANGGRKAGRQDIKQDPIIAAKYKTYGRLRALEESSSRHNIGGQEIASSNSNNRQRHIKRKHAEFIGNNNGDEGKFTPRKVRGSVFTPSRKRYDRENRIDSGKGKGKETPRNHPAVLDPYDSPSVFRRLFSPTTHRQSQQQQPSPMPLRTVVGPTPQRNGKILGLFDMLSASGGSTATPSAKRFVALDQTLIAQTPSRRKTFGKLEDISESTNSARDGKDKKVEEDEDEDQEEEYINSMGRTPASSSKRLYLERLFATPTTLRFATMIEDQGSVQPPQRILYKNQETTSPTTNDQNALGSGTPSFLRRSSSGRFVSSNNDNDPNNPLSPVGVRKFQRYNGKGLTALVQGLRDMENERMEQEWDVLNEIEADQNHGSGSALAKESSDIQVQDSQMPTTEAIDGGDNSGKVWKKKGQKRTTRLVKMKPVIQVKKKPVERTNSAAEDVDDVSNSEDVAPPMPPIVNEDSKSLPRQSKRGRHTGPRPDYEETDEEDPHEEEFDDPHSDSASDSDFTETDSPKRRTVITTTTTKKAPSSFSERLKAAFSSVTVPLQKKQDSNKAGENGGSNEKRKKSSPKKRKVNPETHANYRSLKIRSKGQGRFGRR